MAKNLEVSRMEDLIFHSSQCSHLRTLPWAIVSVSPSLLSSSLHSSSLQPLCIDLILYVVMEDITRIFVGTEIAMPASESLVLMASSWVIDEKL